MRRLISFVCQDARLMGTLDEGRSSAGLLIVSGGNEIRIGAHRGLARLARDVAAQGHPVLRFDRRGIGDSEGDNTGFEGSGDDLSAAMTAFRRECPQLTHIVAFGNCDAAAALLLHATPGLSGLVLANIWIIETNEESDAMPPPAAIKSWYLSRLRDPKAWLGLFNGAVNFRKLANGLMRIARRASPPSALEDRVATALANLSIPATILLANQDGTAAVFQDAWNRPGFAAARANPGILLAPFESASHSFAPDADYSRLLEAVFKRLSS